MDDCASYLAGLVSTAEVLPVVRQQRDKMLTRVVIGALQQSLDALGVKDFSKAMQVSAAGPWQGGFFQNLMRLWSKGDLVSCTDIETYRAVHLPLSIQHRLKMSNAKVQDTLRVPLMCALCMALCKGL